MSRLLLCMQRGRHCCTAGCVAHASRHRKSTYAYLVHAQVRKICCACLVKLYRKGDTLPLYARVSSLQGFLSSKEVGTGRL